jgi:hypothetical protein
MTVPNTTVIPEIVEDDYPESSWPRSGVTELRTLNDKIPDICLRQIPG